MGTSGGYFLPRWLLFRAILVMGFVCFLVVGNLGRVEGTSRKMMNTQYWSSEGVGKVEKRRDNNNSKAVMNHEELDYFNYMSKRRVPNGPDPIHNRRAGNSGRPPGQT